MVDQNRTGISLAWVSVFGNGHAFEETFCQGSPDVGSYVVDFTTDRFPVFLFPHLNGRDSCAHDSQGFPAGLIADSHLAYHLNVGLIIV